MPPEMAEVVRLINIAMLDIAAAHASVGHIDDERARYAHGLLRTAHESLTAALGKFAKTKGDSHAG